MAHQPSKYVALPVEVEAVLFDGTYDSIQDFTQSSYAFGNIEPSEGDPGLMKVTVAVSPNFQRIDARQGDYIVKTQGVAFEVYSAEEFHRRFSPKPPTDETPSLPGADPEPNPLPDDFHPPWYHPAK